MAASSPPPSTLTYQTCLGHGAFGIVLKAVDQSLIASAVKFIFPSSEDQESKELTQISRECKLSSELKPHPNIVQVWDVTERKFSLSEIQVILSDSVLKNEEQRKLKSYYVDKAKRKNNIFGVRIQMELCGENLRTWLNLPHAVNGPTHRKYQDAIIQNLTSGLEHLHDNKIIHRDLKPENVMFCNAGFELPVKIGDFGLSRNILTAERTALTSQVGTRDYMAPEAFTKKYDFRADLYSLGLIIWEVTELIPFVKRRRLFDRLVNGNEENLIQSNADIAQLISRLTKRRVEDRLKNMDEVTNLMKKWKAPEIGFYQCELSTISRVSPEGSQVLVAKISSELHTCLLQATSGMTIKLLDNEYVGKFVLDKDNITLIGEGVAVFFKRGLESGTCLFVSGNHNKISNIKFSTASSVRVYHLDLTGDQNCVKGVEFTGGYCGIGICGRKNILQNIYCAKCDYPISVVGSYNIIDGAELYSIAGISMYVANNSEANMIQNITGINMTRGIDCCGKNNNFHKIHFTSKDNYKHEVGVLLRTDGNSNHIKNLTCINYSGQYFDLEIQSDRSTVMGCTCRKICVWGVDVTVTNVDCDELVVGKEAANATLRNCQAKLLSLWTSVVQIECRFKKTVTK